MKSHLNVNIQVDFFLRTHLLPPLASPSSTPSCLLPIFYPLLPPPHLLPPLASSPSSTLSCLLPIFYPLLPPPHLLPPLASSPYSTLVILSPSTLKTLSSLVSLEYFCQFIYTMLGFLGFPLMQVIYPEYKFQFFTHFLKKYNRCSFSFKQSTRC